ncbi:carboxypeptidase N subunit 2 [Chanos chanos]|uniref:Carboxypeptidase N subunit 2 n=1 Tax=Chanos chanos TaxID=29144 RepID=A0A6J2VCR9_CHACN|nr:carboxypeptidase N subunit 2-like [Chanos chanos]
MMTTWCCVAVFLLLHFSHYGQGCPDQCQCYSVTKVICSSDKMSSLPDSLSSEVRELIVVASGMTHIYSFTLRNNERLTKLVLLNTSLQVVSPGAFFSLTELQELEISGSKYLKDLDVETFSKLGNLRKLLLNHNGVKSLKEGLFDTLHNLETLQLRGNGLTALPPLLFHNLCNLQALDLSDNSIVTPGGSFFQNLKELRSLRLGFNQIHSLQPDMFQNTSHLREIDLQGNRISLLPQEIFAHLNELEDLNLRSNHILGLSPEMFPSSLKVLNLKQNKLFQLSSGSFRSLPRLNVLNLSQNKLSVLPEDLFRNLTSLYHLDLSENHIINIASTAFSGLSKIKFINLESNNLSFIEVDTFRDQKDIERLYLSKNHLKNLPYGFFDVIDFQCILRLHGNPWSCDCGLVYLHEWLEYSSKTVEDLSKVYCDGPSALKGQSLITVDLDQLVCLNSSNSHQQTQTSCPQPVGKGEPSAKNTTLCSIEEVSGAFSINCRLVKCSNVKIEANFDQADIRIRISPSCGNKP